MPDQPLLDAPLDHPLDDLVGRVVLLEAADDLDLAVPLVGGEDGEVAQDIEDDVGAQQAADRGFDFAETGPRPSQRFCQIPSELASSSRHGAQRSSAMRIAPKR